MSILELQAELLRTEFPQLSPDHDPDIERYYNLRALGRSEDALMLYQNQLIPRYPEERFRTNILRAYRTRSPLYVELLHQAYLQLGQRILERTKKLIKYISVKIENFDESDVYSTIKTADQIMALLPRERFEAVMVIQRLHRYAERLRYCEKSMAKAEALISSYVTESLSVVEQERQRRQSERLQAQVKERQRLVAQDKADLQKQRQREAQNARARTLGQERSREVYGKRGEASAKQSQVRIDLNAIRFSAADLSRIQIPPSLSRIEDQTLAFCFKYWNLVYDAAFERILFLYSRKYHSKHYEVFLAIQRGRLNAKRDEEILAAVMGILITGYYYSIQGDRYLQQQWTLLKAKREASEKVNPQETRAAAAPRRQKRLLVKPGAQSESIALAKASLPEPGNVARGTQKQKLESRSIQTKPTSRLKASGTSKSDEQSNLAKNPQNPPLRRFSVSERLMHLSGRSYDVYQDLFLTHVRAAIRKVLGKGKGLFFSIPQDAENLVYDYLKRNYNNPYMNWEQSQERKQLENLGFILPAIEVVIDECYRIMGK